MKTDLNKHGTKLEIMLGLKESFPTGMYKWTTSTCWFRVELDDFQMQGELTWFADDGPKCIEELKEKGVTYRDK